MLSDPVSSTRLSLGEVGTALPLLDASLTQELSFSKNVFHHYASSLFQVERRTLEKQKLSFLSVDYAKGYQPWLGGSFNIHSLFLSEHF